MSKAKPTEKKADAIVKSDDGDAAEQGKRSKAAWLMGWVLLPGTVVGVIWGGGVLIGAHFHDSWFTRAIVWTVGLF